MLQTENGDLQNLQKSSKGYSKNHQDMASHWFMSVVREDTHHGIFYMYFSKLQIAVALLVWTSHLTRSDESRISNLAIGVSEVTTFGHKNYKNLKILILDKTGKYYQN